MCVREPKIRRMFIILPYGAEAMNDSPVGCQNRGVRRAAVRRRNRRRREDIPTGKLAVDS